MDPAYGYRPPTILARRQIGDVLLLLAFSGGGTRAAALAYGVLQELRDTPIGNGRRLLDEVDAITSVSGGSFTSAYYGLYGDRIFTEFETRFLRRNVQRRLILGLLNPINWFKLLSPFFDRSDVAIAYYDDNIFEHATFADLLAANGPLLQINATDLGAGHQFTFYQPQFDLLCSDLATFRSHAPWPRRRRCRVSSARSSCGTTRELRLPAAAVAGRRAQARKTDPPRFRIAKIVEGYLDVEERPYVDLLDGGIADNLGLRVPLDNVALAGGPLARAEQLDMRINSVAVIVVNAEVHPPPRFELGAKSPGLAAVLGAISDTQIYGYNFDTLEMMRESLQAGACAPARARRPSGPHPHGRHRLRADRRREAARVLRRRPDELHALERDGRPPDRRRAAVAPGVVRVPGASRGARRIGPRGPAALTPPRRASTRVSK
jgi:NTE family protein